MREQFRLAEGGVLDYADPVPSGHSIEFRINGEDPGRGFLPPPGPVHVLRFPGGPGVRVDSGVTTGDEISGAFDSLLAQAHRHRPRPRTDALERSRRALDEFEVAGLPTVLPFHRDIVRNPAFAPEGDEPFSVYTRWIETEYDNQHRAVGGRARRGHAARRDRTRVVVEVAGRRIEVTPAEQLVGGASATGAAHGRPRTAPPRRRRTRSTPPPATP